MENKGLDFQLNADLDLISKNKSTERILEASITAPKSDVKKDRPGFNLAFVIDRSGSMAHQKLEYVKQAVIYALDLLTEKDHVALVIYDDEPQTLAYSTAVTEAHRRDLKDLVETVRTGGSTNLAGGWLQGCDEIAESKKEGVINRCLLLTDGLANVGITDPQELAMHAHELHNRGISTSTFGVGLDYNEHLLEIMARQGTGNYYFIEHPDQSREIFQRELSEMMEVTASDTEISLQLPAGVDAFVYGNWKQEQKKQSLRIFLGDIPAGQTRKIYIKLTFMAATPSTDEKKRIEARVMAKSKTNEVIEEKGEFFFKPISQKALENGKRDEAFMRRFAIVEIAHVTGEALKLDREGKRKQAISLMKECLESNDPYLELKQREYYMRVLVEMEMGMREDNRKFHHESSQILYQRMDMPKARYDRK
jgi:Ca-activated chloride channel family protein